MNEVAICLRLRKAREAGGITRRFVTEKSGVNHPALVNYEHGRAPLRYNLTRNFCQALGVNPAWLATGKGAMKGGSFLPTAAELGLRDTALFSEGYRLHRKKVKAVTTNPPPMTAKQQEIIDRLDEGAKAIKAKLAAGEPHTEHLDSALANLASAKANLLHYYEWLASQSAPAAN